MQKVILFIVSLFIISCSSIPSIEVRNPFVNPETEDVINHQPWPSPVQPLPKNIISTVVYEDENGNEKSITGFDWDDQQTFRIWEERREEHVQLLEQLICSYRKELKEERCKRYVK